MPALPFRLTIMFFLQFFSWGAWLITLGRYLANVMNCDGQQIGYLFATAGIASIVMPALLGYIADKWFRAERVFGCIMLLTAAALLWMGSLSADSSFGTIFIAILCVNLFFMPSISLSNTIAYSTLGRNGNDIVRIFPNIRVWGTIGFIGAMWLVDALNVMDSPWQFYISAIATFILGLYSFTIPACYPEGKGKKTGKGIAAAMGLDALALFRDKKMAIFFIFSILLGAALQLTNAYGNMYLDSFKGDSAFSNSFVVKFPNILLSLSQISETLFILTIPFFLKKFGIKTVMILSFLAWFLRFGLFGIGDPGFPGWIAFVLSMIVYGMAFDFFNISGSMFVEQATPKELRAGAQGLFVLMTNGLGTIIGTLAGGAVVKAFQHETTTNWQPIWFIFAGYALIIGILFSILFRYKQKQPSKN